MVRTTLPLFSLSAAGTIARTLTYASNRSGPFARLRTKPGDPRTQKQLAHRTAMLFSARAWAVLSAANKATWNNEPFALKFTPYHAFCHTNLQRYRQQLGFTQRPATYSVPTASTYDTPSIANVAGQVHITFPNLVPNGDWGMYLWRKHSSPVTRTYKWCLGVILLDTSRTYTFYDLDPLAGANYYRGRTFRKGGLWSVLTPEFNVTI